MNILEKREPVDFVQMMKEKPLKICAPMVRFSKLPFRILVRKYGCDLAYTSMIMSDSFIKSQKSREIEFVTSVEEAPPLVVQFAANNISDFVGATQLVYGYCDGVDLNCGCPQGWAMKEGYGSALLYSPQKIFDIVRQTRNQVVSSSNFSLSVKLRLLKSLPETVDMFRQIEMAGVSYIGVHARTPAQRNEPADVDALTTICDSLKIPVIANGDCFSLDNFKSIIDQSGANGAMAARGMLENPAMFAGYKSTPLCCIEDFLKLCIQYGFNFASFKKLFYWMIERICTKSERLNIISCQSMPQLIEYFEENFGIKVMSNNGETDIKQ